MRAGAPAREPWTQITHYAIVDDYTTNDNPAGVLRRFDDGDRRDESFGRDLGWKFSSLLHSAEKSDFALT